MKFITLVLALCANTLFGQTPSSWKDINGNINYIEVVPNTIIAGSGITLNRDGNKITISADTIPPKRDTSHYTLELLGSKKNTSTITISEGALGVADGGAFMTTNADSPNGGYLEVTYDMHGGIMDMKRISPIGDSLKDVVVHDARDTVYLPQAWQDSTEWDAPYDPNLFFHKNHEWVYSEFDDLNQEYQKLHPYPLGGFEHQGRICKVCKTKQQRTIYYGVGKNPFKKVITNSPYSQLLLQSRQ